MSCKKKIKSVVSTTLLSTFIVALIGGLNAYASQDILSISVLVSKIKVFIGNSDYNIKESNGADIKILNDNGVTYAPIRAMGEALGKDVIWDGENNRIVLKDTDTVAEYFSFDEYNKTKFPLIAAIPEKNIHLYGINPRGVVLYNDSVGQLFDWNYLTPRGILPQITSKDFNGDGVDEIGVSLYWGSGTGISIEQLHVLEMSKDKLGDNLYIDNEFMETDYTEQLRKILQYEYDPKDKKLTLRIKDKTYQYQCERDFSGLNHSDIVDFEFEGDSIKGIFHLGIAYENEVTYDYVLGALVAEVKFENGKFTLINPRIDENFAFPT